jgi:hypothetical protein
MVGQPLVAGDRLARRLVLLLLLVVAAGSGCRGASPPFKHSKGTLLSVVS